MVSRAGNFQQLVGEFPFGLPCLGLLAVCLTPVVTLGLRVLQGPPRYKPAGQDEEDDEAEECGGAQVAGGKAKDFAHRALRFLG